MRQTPMKISTIVAFIAILAGTLSAGAADNSRLPQPLPQGVERAQKADELPFPRSERAQSIWAADTCWRDCSANCAWGVAGCLRRDEQGVCLSKGDTCDRYCQRQCRSSGGPLLNMLD